MAFAEDSPARRKLAAPGDQLEVRSQGVIGDPHRSPYLDRIDLSFLVQAADGGLGNPQEGRDLGQGIEPRAHVADQLVRASRLDRGSEFEFRGNALVRGRGNVHARFIRGPGVDRKEHMKSRRLIRSPMVFRKTVNAVQRGSNGLRSHGNSASELSRVRMSAEIVEGILPRSRVHREGHWQRLPGRSGGDTQNLRRRSRIGRERLSGG
jgi:hypothetical protein